ncbi:MAG TPA: hypothetical protein VFM82_03670 [Flavobacteriaceae bacterium]|nr:hypothetical protein [Flavobacteriaceae bacterium]
MIPTEIQQRLKEYEKEGGIYYAFRKHFVDQIYNGVMPRKNSNVLTIWNTSRELMDEKFLPEEMNVKLSWAINDARFEID